MKKIFLFLAVILCSTANMFSQIRSEEINDYVNAFEADSVVWRSHNAGWNPIQETLLYGDTLVNDTKWKILTIGTLPYLGTKGLLRTENRKVIVMAYPGFEKSFSAIGEMVLFDFSLEEGDYLREDVKVISVDSVELNDGRKHKRIQFRDINTINIPYYDEFWGQMDIVEGVGCIGFDLLERLYFTPIERDWGTLMCCHVDGKLLYMNPVYLDCEGNKVANEIVENPKPTVVFADGILHVTFNDDDLFDVTVYNIQGQMVMHNKNNQNTMLANLENLPKGVYVVRISSGNNVYSEKVMK
jgi:hypothetical protein